MSAVARVAARARGFSLVEVMVALVIGLGLVAGALVVVQSSRADFATNENLARLQDSARLALGLIRQDIEHAGFMGFAGLGVQLVSGGTVLAGSEQLRQPAPGEEVPAVAGLPAGAHDCGVNFAVDLARAVQGSDNSYRLGVDARDCAPTGTADGARPGTDTLTVRYASRARSEPRAGRVQVYASALASASPLLLFADGRAPGPRDDLHEVRDVEVRSYYVANNSVDRPGWPALRVKALTESRGGAQFRDEEILPGVEDLQVEFAVAEGHGESRQVRYVNADSPRAASQPVIAVRLWLRLRAEVPEPGFEDPRPLAYANVSFTPVGTEIRQRRLLVQQTVALRNARS